MNRILRCFSVACFACMVGVMMTNAAFAGNKYSGTCSGKVITKYGTSDNYCCTTSTTTDWTSSGYARGYTEADGSIQCCVVLECRDAGFYWNSDSRSYVPNNSYCYPEYTGIEVSRLQTSRIWANMDCVTISGVNNAVVSGSGMYRSSDTIWSTNNQDINRWGSYSCGNLNSSGLPSTNYTSWSYIGSGGQYGNRAYTDCRAYAYRTETGCTNNRVMDTYKQTIDDYYTPGWVHASYSSLSAQPGYIVNTSTGKCTACGTNQYSPGGSATTCKECPYYNPSGGYTDSQWDPIQSARHIWEGFSSSNSLASQGTGAGATCIYAGTTQSGTGGVYSTSACTFTDDNYSYGVAFQFSSGYCTKSLASFASDMCSNIVHCSGNNCAGCNNGHTWISSVSGCTLSGSYGDTIYADCPTLYDAQTLTSFVSYYAGSARCFVNFYID